MIVLNNPIQLYGKKVITDLATRTGQHTLDSYSYGTGLEYVVQSYWTDPNTDANIAMLFNDQIDFNADKVKPQFDEDEYSETAIAEQEDLNIYNPAVDALPYKGYYRRLEDVAPQYLEKYVSNLVYTICYKTGGLKDYQAKHREQPTLISQSDEDDFTELSDLALMPEDEHEWSPDSKLNAKQQLPYVIKRLHNMSCYTGVHMLTYIAAFIKARDKNEKSRMAGYTKTLKKNAVIQEGVYLCNSNGNITKRVAVENKNKAAAAMFDWIIGASTDYTAYYQDYLNFVHYCNVLNIDLFTEDFTKYQEDYVNALVVTTVTPNDQYDRQVFDALRSSGETTVTLDEEIDVVENATNLFQQALYVEPSLQQVSNTFTEEMFGIITDEARTIHRTHMLVKGDVLTDLDKYEWLDGLLHYDGVLVELPVSTISSEQFIVNKFIISELGYCIQLSDNNSLYLLTTTNALSNLTHKIRGDADDYKEKDWWRITV